MDDFVLIYKALNETEANIIKIALEDSGIPATVHPHNTSWLDGLFVSADGSWGDVLVSRKDAEQAIELLKEYDRASDNGHEEEI